MQMATMQLHNEPGANGRAALAAAYRVRCLQEMLSRQVADTRDEPDPDRIDLQDFKFYIGDEVTLYHREREEGEQYRVIDVLDEMLSLRCISSPSEGMVGTCRWEPKDNDELLFGDTYFRLRRTRVRQELLEQRQAQAQARAAAMAQSQGHPDDPEDEDDSEPREGHRAGRQRGGQEGQGGHQVTAQHFAGGNDYQPLSSDDLHSSEDEVAQ